MKTHKYIRHKLWNQTDWPRVTMDDTTGECWWYNTGVKCNLRWSEFQEHPDWETRVEHIETQPDLFKPGEIVSKDDPRIDMVNSPSHYKDQGSIECIDYIKSFLTREEYIGYLRGNIAKYLHRWRYKNGMEDLKKADWYKEKLNEVAEEEE